MVFMKLSFWLSMEFMFSRGVWDQLSSIFRSWLIVQGLLRSNVLFKVNIFLITMLVLQNTDLFLSFLIFVLSMIYTQLYMYHVYNLFLIMIRKFTGFQSESLSLPCYLLNIGAFCDHMRCIFNICGTPLFLGPVCGTPHVCPHLLSDLIKSRSLNSL